MISFSRWDDNRIEHSPLEFLTVLFIIFYDTQVNIKYLQERSMEAKPQSKFLKWAWLVYTDGTITSSIPVFS